MRGLGRLVVGRQAGAVGLDVVLAAGGVDQGLEGRALERVAVLVLVARHIGAAEAGEALGDVGGVGGRVGGLRGVVTRLGGVVARVGRAVRGVGALVAGGVARLVARGRGVVARMAWMSAAVLVWALFLALLKGAMEEKRGCYLMLFSTEVATLEITADTGLEKAERFLSMSFHGGTDLVPCLEKALAKLLPFQRADFVFGEHRLRQTSAVAQHHEVYPAHRP